MDPVSRALSSHVSLSGLSFFGPQHLTHADCPSYSDEMLDPSMVDELRSRQHGRILPEGETLPIAFEDVFADFVSTLKEVWRPNAQVNKPPPPT